MQQTRPFSLRRIRSYDQVATDTFIFLRTHIRPLGRHILFIVAPIVVVSTLILRFSALDFSGSVYEDTPLAILSDFETVATITYFIGLILAQIITCVYIVLCNDNGGESPSPGTVRAGVREMFWKLLLGDVLCAIITSIGLFLITIPGVYMGLALSMMAMVISEENISAFAGVDRCFSLVKERWWRTFGTALFLYLTLLPLFVTTWVPDVLYTYTAESIGIDSMLLYYIAYVAVDSIVTSAANICMVVIFNTGMAMLYYSLVESREAVGLRERIDGILPPAVAEAEA